MPLRRIALDEDARVGHERFGIRRAHADNLGAATHPKGAQLEAPPDGAGAAELRAAAEPCFIVLAGLDEIDAEELRSQQRQDHGRADGAEDIGNGIGDRHRVEIFLGLLRQTAPGG
jgi:hypothetical protein